MLILTRLEIQIALILTRLEIQLVIIDGRHSNTFFFFSGNPQRQKDTEQEDKVTWFLFSAIWLSAYVIKQEVCSRNGYLISEV